MTANAARGCLIALALVLGAALRLTVLDAAPAPAVEPPQTLQTPQTLLKFGEFFQMPVGPRGLQPTPKLIALHGQPVRIRGYMAHAEVPAPGMFILSPLPVELGDDDEGLADDLPPAVLFVHWSSAPGAAVRPVPGILELAGILHVGAQEELDGRVSQVRLELDPPQVQALVRAGLQGGAVSPPGH